MLVVIVDDDDGILDMVSRMLRICGINDSIKARDAKEFYGVMKDLHKNGLAPDLIMLDVMMPEITGHEILQTMKKYSFTKPIPVVIMTAAVPLFEKMQKENTVEYEGLLPKPFGKGELAETICKVTCNNTIQDVVKSYAKKEKLLETNENAKMNIDKLKETWKVISSRPDERLIQLIFETNRQLHGQVVDRDIIKKFLKSKLVIVKS